MTLGRQNVAETRATRCGIHRRARASSRLAIISLRRVSYNQARVVSCQSVTAYWRGGGGGGNLTVQRCALLLSLFAPRTLQADCTISIETCRECVATRPVSPLRSVTHCSEPPASTITLSSSLKKIHLLLLCGTPASRDPRPRSRHWSSPWCTPGWTTATACWSASQPISCADSSRC